MIPPTSIDGTDITGATIDGTDVQEITVDGQTVFSAGPSNLPVAYSNLVAWYPFDSATYGGSNADDVTAILGGSGDDTAYDGTVRDDTTHTTGTIFDINAGANSGGFEFQPPSNTEPNTGIDLGSAVFDSTAAFTITCWVRWDNNEFAWSNNDFNNGARLGQGSFRLYANGSKNAEVSINQGSAVNHWAAKSDGAGTIEAYKNGSSVGTDSGVSNGNPTNLFIGALDGGGFNNAFDGFIDDFRIYNTDLNNSQIQDIYDNTDPNQNP